MENLIVHSIPELTSPMLVATFAGWPDAGEAGTGAVRYLRDKLGAAKFAELRPEEFYVFTELRPQTSIGETPWVRRITWPSNELYYWKGGGPSPDLILFLGIEPNLRWAAFVGAILDLAQRLSVARVVALGGTLDSVPHTREPPISGSASQPDLRQALERLLVGPSDYQGPTSIHAALLDECGRRGIPTASLWGHAPLYLQATPNPKVCLALLRKLLSFLHLEVDLEELEDSARAFGQQVDQAVAKNPELQGYVRRLEDAYQKAQQAAEEMPSPEAVVRDLEEYLRRRRKGQANDSGE